MFQSSDRRPVARVDIYCGFQSKIDALVGWQNISLSPYVCVIISKIIPRIKLLNEVTVSVHLQRLNSTSTEVIHSEIAGFFSNFFLDKIYHEHLKVMFKKW